MKIVKKKVMREETDNVATGLKARELRLAKGWTYRQTAAKMKCSFAYLSDLEKGYRSWGGKIGKRYAELLGG